MMVHVRGPGFLGRNAEASLKRRHLGGIRRRHPCFLGRNAEASLKQGGAQCLRPIQRRFLGRNAEASLKPNLRGREVDHRGGFLGRNAEASLKPGDHTVTRVVHRRFLGRNAEASLKPSTSHPFPNPTIEFPRQKCRGLIEAAGSAKKNQTIERVSSAEMPRPH